MSEDKIEVNMNVYDIPILVEALEKANKEIERLNGVLQTHEILLKSNVLEIERLNNIINELENFICDLEYEFTSDNPMWRFVVIIHNKLKELKGSDESDNNIQR